VLLAAVARQPPARVLHGKVKAVRAVRRIQPVQRLEDCGLAGLVLADQAGHIRLDQHRLCVGGVPEPLNCGLFPAPPMLSYPKVETAERIRYSPYHDTGERVVSGRDDTTGDSGRAGTTAEYESTHYTHELPHPTGWGSSVPRRRPPSDASRHWPRCGSG